MSVKRFYACLFFVVLLLSSSYADWKSEANARIESIRKRNAEIWVVDPNGNPVPDVSVQIEQFKHRFAFGTCITNGQMSNNNYKNFILNHFEWAVCENETKWTTNEPSRDSETYGAADYIYNWCHNNDIAMRGHCLFWEQLNNVQTWVQALPYATYPTPSQLLDEVDERIDHAVDHFKNKFYNWDVDNEMLPTGSDYQFYNRLGEGGRVHMFQRANTVDPNCKFFMNEYSGNSFGGYNSSGYVSRASSLISLGAPIDGFGIQAHLAENATFLPQSYYDNVLQPLAALNRPIWATEFDASHIDVTTSADNIENFFRICFSHSSVEGIIMWGFWQSSMWRPNAYLVDNNWNLTERGVRYEALMDEWTTEDANITNATGRVNFRGFHGTYEITLTKAGEANEIHEIELEPGEGTAQFILETNFPGGPPDTTPPTPNPMTWASPPSATGRTSITMTATTANDISGVEYYFDCNTAGGHDSGWQDSNTYQDTGLSPGTQYSYRVKARDKSLAHNETGWSSTQSATTWPPDLTPPEPDPMTWASMPTAVGSTRITMTATTATDESPPVEYYFECITDANKSHNWQTSPTYLATGLKPSTLYTFRVKARDNALTQHNETGWSSSQSATTEPPGTYVNIIGSWLTGTTHTKESGDNRALLFIAHVEEAGAIDLSSVTYGDQPMTKVIDIIVGTGTNNHAYVAAYILDEAGIAAATTDGTFAPTWSTTPDTVAYASVFLSNVDQTALVGATDSNSIATSGQYQTITTNALSTGEGDMVIVAATDGQPGDYTVNNGFTKALEHDMGSSAATGVDGYKSATSLPETPSVTMVISSNRQVIIGFVIQAIPVDMPPSAPTGLAAAPGNGMVTLDWNNNNEPDLNGYNVYRSTTQGSDYNNLNDSLLSDSNYIDNNVTNGTTYYYVVTAVDINDHESDYSNEESAKPNYQDCNDVQDANYGLLSDLNGDCYVNYKDLKIMSDYWLNTECSEPSNCQGADFEPTDGIVDFFDFGDFAEQWMQCNDPQDADCT